VTSAKAFGKIIVLGEHAVVYGEPALAGALSAGCVVDVEKSEHGVPHLMLDTQVFKVSDADNGVCKAVRIAQEAAGIAASALDVTIRFDVPVGAGLGSSAAMSVALPRAMFARADKTLDDATLRELSNQIEKVFHGNPSGLDALLAMTGSLGLFTKKGGLTPIAAKQPVRVIIADTGVQRSTQTQVSNVAARRERLGRPVEQTIEAIGQLSRMGAEALQKGDLAKLGELMNTNQGLLSALSVSSAEIEHLVHVARKAGAIGAKLTGAGGGGCIIALAPPGDEEIVASALRKHSKTVLITNLGAP
jgi:mevalonate kinase